MTRGRFVLVTTLVVLTFLNLLWPRDPSPLESTSFGKSGAGHGAVYDLLQASGLSRGRSFESARRLADEGTLWFIDPLGVCTGRIALRGDGDVLDEYDVQWPGTQWLEAGGTAVVFLQAADPGGPLLEPQEGLVVCDAIAGADVPRRDRLEGPAMTAPALEVPEPREFVVEGDGVPEPRRTWQKQVYGFEEALDWEVLATVRDPGLEPEEGGGPLPFVLTRAVGEGRLVVVADSGFTHNAWLDRGDAAALATELAATFGAPRFDEREHGILLESSAMRYIASSPALPIFAGLLMLGLLYAWRGNALPSRSVAEFDPAAPTLDSYVGSMASLFGSTRDHARVLERYCELTASRLKRHLGLPQEVSRRALVERIESDARSVRESRRDPEAARARGERLERLVEPPAVESKAAVLAQVRELDALVLEVTR